jgi:myosin-5
LDALEKKNSAIELELIEAQKNGNDTTVKLQEIEEKCSQFQQTVRRYSSVENNNISHPLIL